MSPCFTSGIDLALHLKGSLALTVLCQHLSEQFSDAGDDPDILCFQADGKRSGQVFQDRGQTAMFIVPSCQPDAGQGKMHMSHAILKTNFFNHWQPLHM